MTEPEFSAGEDAPSPAPEAAGQAAPDAAGHEAPEAAGSPAPDAAGHEAPEAAGHEAGEDAAPVEVVDGVPVLAEVRAVEHPVPPGLPTVQVAAVAATGFVAGAATVALVKRRTARKLARSTGRNGGRRAADMLPIAATRSFLVDVHVIAKPE
jgi:hypothetical protein